MSRDRHIYDASRGSMRKAYRDGEQKKDFPWVILALVITFLIAAPSCVANFMGASNDQVGTCVYTMDTNKNMVITPKDGETGEIPDFVDFKPPWNTKNAKSVKFEGNVLAPVDASWLFGNCPNLERVDLSGLNTCNTTDMSHLFDGCSDLQEVNIECLDMGDVTDISGMFANIDNDVEISYGGWDIRNLETFDGVFDNSPAMSEDYTESFTTKIIQANAGFVTPNEFQNREHIKNTIAPGDPGVKTKDYYQEKMGGNLVGIAGVIFLVFIVVWFGSALVGNLLPRDNTPFGLIGKAIYARREHRKYMRQRAREEKRQAKWDAKHGMGDMPPGGYQQYPPYQNDIPRDHHQY